MLLFLISTKLPMRQSLSTILLVCTCAHGPTVVFCFITALLTTLFVITTLFPKVQSVNVLPSFIITFLPITHLPLIILLQSITLPSPIILSSDIYTQLVLLKITPLSICFFITASLSLSASSTSFIL